MKLPNWIRKLTGGRPPVRRRRIDRRREELFAELNVTRLETRRVLNGDGLASELVVDAGADANDGHADAFHLQVDQDQVHVSVNGERVNSVSADQVDTITIHGSTDDDSLVIDLGDGSMAQQTIRFDGGQGQDSVRIITAGHIESLIHAIESPGVVDTDLRSAAGGSEFQFEGIEDLSHDLSVDHLTVQLGNDADRVTLDQSDVAGVSQLQVWQSFDANIDSQSPLTMSFGDPNESLRIISDVDGETDADRVDVKGLSDSFAASFVFQGDANDLIVFSGETNLGGGDVRVTAGRVQLSSAIHTDDAEVEFVATEELTLTATGSVVNHGGTVELSGPSLEMDGSIEASAGFVSLDSGGNGIAIVRGQIDVSSDQAGQQGGVVHVLGFHVGLLDQARIDASGSAGGGTVLIGGDYLGKGEVTNAYVTYLSHDSIVRADSHNNGRGGKVIVWADHTTRMHGTISARGGGLGGDGGLIETSGKVSLDVTASSVNASAARGVAGTWLLDPLDVTISDGSTQNNIPNTGGLFTPNGNNANIGDDIINAALDAGTNVTITTDSGDAGDNSDDGDIQLNANADIVLSTAQTVTLKLIAAGHIDLRGTITTATGTLNVELVANDNSGTQTDQKTAEGDVLVKDVVTTGGGTFTASGVNFDNSGGAITTGDGLVTLNHTGNVKIGAAIDAGVGDVGITTTGGDINGGGTVTAATLTLDASGGIGTATTFNTDVDSLDLTTGGSGNTGDITLVEADGASLTVATDATAQAIQVTATTGDLTIGGATGDGNDNVTLITLAGNVDGGATVTANALVINASGGIGIGTTFSADAASYSLTTLGAGALGNITLVDTGALNTSQITTLSSVASVQTVSLTATTGDLTINSAIGNTTDNLTLTATAGNIVGGLTATAATLTLDANGGIGIGTAVTANATTYVLTTSGADAAGDIHLSDTNTLNTSQVTLTTAGTSQTVHLTALTGHLTVGNAIGNSTDNLTLTATAGNVVGGATATAATLTVSAGLGIGIGTTLNTDSETLDLSSGGAAGAGDITVIEADAVDLSVATAATAQTVSVTVSSGDLTVGGAIGDANDNLSLIASAGNLVGGVETVSANALTLNASGGIGIGTAVQANATSYSLTTTGVANAGDIVLVDTGAFNTNQITLLSTDASKQLVSLTATTGDLTLGAAIGNSVDDLTLVATAGNIVGGATATANALTLNAGQGIGVGTAVTADATSYSLTTAGAGTDGNITLVDVGALNTTQITTLATHTSAQTISLTATTGNLTVGNAIGDATDNLTLIATAGDVVGGATATAATLTINANGGIGIGATFHSDADTLDLTSAGAINAGNITIVEADTANLSVTTDASVQTVDVTLTTGDLTISGAVGDANDNINLTTSGGDVVGGATVTADTLTIDASGGIGIGTALDTDANTLDLTSGGTDAAGDITVVQATAANLMIATDTSGQTISITLTTGDFTVGGAIGDGNDSLTFIASAGNIVGGGTVIANDLTLNASGGIGIGTAVTANAATYSLTTNGAAAAGNITLIDTGALNTSQITTLVTAGTVQTIDLTATTGDLTVGGAIGQANDHLNLTAVAGDIVGGGATATADTLTLDASGGIGIGTAVQANATSYSLTTTGVANAGDIVLVDTGAFNTNQITLLSTVASKQLVSLTATTGDLTLGAAIGNSVDDLTLVATAGNIVGGATATANALTLNAGQGIGVGTAVTADATSYSLTTAGTDGAGDITLIDIAALNTTQISTLTTHTSAQTISLTATTDDLTVGAAIGDAADNLTLIAIAGDVDGGATATAATLTINANGGIGIGATFHSDADTLDLTSAGTINAGNITIIEADTANLSVTTDASVQTVDVTLTTGDLTISGAVGDANDNINLTTSGGNVVGGATVTADTLTIDASGGIGIGTALDTDANTLDLTSGGTDAAGDITVVQATAANLMIATDTSGQTISITLTTGDFTVGGAIGDGNDSLTFIASAGNIVGGGTVIANDLTLNASGGIGIGTAVTANAATYSLTTNGAAAAGNITLIDTGALNTSQITTLVTAGTVQTIDLTATTGDLTVGGAIGQANDHLNLTAVAGDIVGGGATATADTLTLDASGGIGIGTAVQTNATSYSLTTTGVGNAGDIVLVDTGAFNTNQITLLSTVTSKQLVSLTATTGDLTLGAAIGNSVDDLTLVATAGNIVGGATATANALTLNAGAGIGVGTAVTADATSYSLTTAGTDGAGDITLIDIAALNTTQISTLTTHTSAQTVSLTATTDDLTVGAAIGDATDNLTLIATAGDVDGGATATAATLTINANGGIGIGATFHSDADTLDLTSAGTINAGNITIIEADTANLSVTTDASVQTVNVTLTTGDLTISGAVGDANDNINLTTSGGNVVGGATVTADTLTIDASGGIGIGTALDTDANTLDLTSGGTDAAGDITVVQATAANLMIATDTSGQTISITLTTGDFTVGGAIGDGNDSLTFIASAGNIVGGGTVIANDLTLNASGGIGIGTAVTANAATYSLTTNGAAAAGNITLIDTGALNTSQITTLVTAGTVQTIDLTATTGDLTVGGAIGQANDHLNLTAVAGDIVGGGATATADTLTLDASGGIGIGTAVQANATSYSLTTTGVANAGDIVLVDTGAFNTNQITLLSTVASKQLVSLTATTGDLTLGAAIGNSVDDLTLVATAGNIVGGATATADALTLNAGQGIGIGTAVTADATSYSLTTAGAGTDGNITLVDVGALNTTQITTLATHTSAQTISLTATTGNLTVGNGIGDATDNLTLIAIAGDVDGGATATAETLTVNASGGIGNGTALMTDANTLSLVTSGFNAAGNITVIQADAANLSVATDGSAQTIDVTLTTGDFTLGGTIGDASDSLSFTAAGGDIVGGGTVTANTLTLNASGGIGIGTAVTANATTYHLTTLGADAAGNITLVDTGAFNTNQIATLSTAASVQTISLTATTGDLTVGAAIGNATDNLALIASAGDVIGGATATAATLTVNADGGIGIGIALNTNADTLNLTSGGAAANGNITVIQASAANLSVDTAATGQTVDVTVSAGDLTISGPVGDANDDVNLTIQSGNVVGGSFAVTADTLTIDASGGIGIGVELDTDADTLDLTTHGVAVAGNISIVQADAANFSIATDTSGQTISVTLTTGDFTVGGAIGDGNDSLTFIANDGNIVGGGTVTANDLTLSASGGIGIGTAVTANAATYSLTTTGIGTDGNIRLVDTNGLNTNQITTLSTHSSTQTISLTASTGNLTVESSIGDANDHLSLISTLGNVDGGATATAATLTLNAGGGIGIGAALTVDATSYSLTTAGAGTAGNINLVDANALNTNEITTLVTDGSVQTIHLTASAGDLTTGSAIGNNSDHLTLTTLAGNVEGGATVTADTLTVNSSGGIGILTAFATDVNTLNLTTDGIGAAGDISVIQADASNLSIATDASAQTISVTLNTGDFTIGGAIGDGNDSLTFIASGGDIVGGLGTVTANVLTLNASGGIGIGIGNAVTADATTYNLTTAGTNAAGNITLIDAGAFDTNQITTLVTHGSAQRIDLTANSGDLTVGGAIGQANDDLNLTAAAGNIVGGGAAVTANALTLDASGGIGIGMAVQANATSYSLKTTGVGNAGDIALVDTGAFNTNQVTMLSTGASAQTVSLTANTGDLTIGTNIGNAIDDLTLVATAGDIVGGVATTATAAMLTLDAGGGIGIGIAVTADAASYSLTTAGTNADGDITLIDTAALNTNQITTLDTDASAQTVSLTATTGDLTVGDAIGDATDSLTLIAAAGNVVGGAKATADMLTVTANGGIGTGPVLETDANTLNLTTSGVGAAGNIRVEEFDATTYVVNTHASAQLIQLTQSNGDITIGGAIGDGGDSLTFVASAGNIEGSGTTVTANALVLQAGGGIGTVTEITANAASYSLSTLGAGAAGNITLVDTNSLNTSQITNLSTGTTPQTVSLTASLGNLTVDAAIGDAGDDLSLNALVGNVEGGATATATNLTVQAGGGIGIGAVLNTNADTLNLTTSGVNGLGNITVVESDAVNLSITTVGSAQTVNARVLNGNLTISNPFGDANDNLTLITSNGDVVGGGTVTADTLTINSSGGIGNGIPLQTDANTLDLTSAGIGLAGNISVVQADAANLSIATDVSGQMISVTLTTGDFTVGGAIGDGNDSLMFAASDGNIIGGAGTVTANDLTLFASGGIGITTAVTANAATYNLETQGVDAAGNIELISVNTLNTDQITLTTAGSTQTIDLSVSAGDLIVGGAIGDSMDNLNLNTSAGNIVGGGATVSAATLTIVSAGGIGVGMALNTDASALNLTTNGADAAGNITVVENDAVALSINTAASTQTASVTVRNGNLTVGGPIGDSNDNLILITSNGDVNGGSTVTANNLTVNASGGIGIDAFLLTNANTILLTSAGFGSAGDITVKDVGSADFMIGTDASSQTIDLTTRTGDFNIGGAIGDVNDHLRFTAILGDINGGGTVTANSLTLSAGRGIGTVAAVRGNAASYSLTSSAVGAAGNISLVDTGPLNTSQITTLSTDGSSQTVTLTSETANLTVDSLIGDSNDDLTLIATAGDVIGGGVATAGTLRLVAAGGIGVGTALTADATTYELSTTGVDSAGNIALVHQGALNTSQLATLSTDASTQTISLTASASDLTVDAALHHANDNFELIASGGGVQNTGASVTANALSVDAITGINLNTSVTSFEAINRVGGDIQVTESDAVTILMVEQFSPGDVSISAGGTIDLSNGGRMPSRITSGSGSISLQAVGAASDLNVNGWVTSGTGQITLRADDDLALGAVARVTTGSNDAVSVTLSANDDGAGSGVLAFNDSAIVATDKGQISGVLVNSPTPISGTQVGELLGGTQRNAQIDVTVNDPAGLGFVAEVDWLEGNPGDSDPSRRNPLEKNISTGGVGVNFQHSYDVAPNQGDINVNVSLTSIADGSIVLRQNTTDLLDRPEFTTTVTLRVEGALLPFSAPLPEADNVDFVRTFEQIVVTTPATQRIVFVTPPLQFNNSVGSAVVTSQRYYVLRIVSFGAESEGEVKLWDSQPGREEYSLPDLEDPNSGEGFELSQLPELFKRLPDDRYRIYLIEGQTERLVLDFIIRDGQPIESQSDDQPVQESEATESDGEMDAEPAAGPIERPNLSSVERLGSVPVVSTGGIVLAAGMAKRDQRRHGRQWRNASAQPERDRNNMSARRPASWR